MTSRKGRLYSLDTEKGKEDHLQYFGKSNTFCERILEQGIMIVISAKVFNYRELIQCT